MNPLTLPRRRALDEIRQRLERPGVSRKVARKCRRQIARLLYVAGRASNQELLLVKDGRRKANIADREKRHRRITVARLKKAEIAGEVAKFDRGEFKPTFE